MSSAWLTFTFLLIKRLTVSSIEYHPTVTNNVDIDCDAGPSGKLGPNDICRIVCDLDGNDISSIDCGSAGTCILECPGQGCMKYKPMNASNSKNLEIYATGGDCIDNIDLYLPINGNATIVIDTEGVTDIDNIAQGAKLFSQSTDHIWITCIDSNPFADPGAAFDECEDLEIYATDAQFLSITSIGAELDRVGGGEIHCPENSNYNGPYPASCIINATYAHKASDLKIYTKNGYPQDVMFYDGGAASVYTDTTIYCDPPGYNTEMVYPFTSAGACWNTGAPTTSQPTATPTTTMPTTNMPTTVAPTTNNPTTHSPTTSVPTTTSPTTAIPTTFNPTTTAPTTFNPTTSNPTTFVPTTTNPTTATPTTAAPTTSVPTTANPTTTTP
eukprot:525810_1